jgi:N12 class adenine-specific DNA methylase
MNQTIRLREHQKDAVWRGMSSGNTLLAHAVGAGKTYTMAATGMKMKQAGLIKKPMFVVPNHLLEQFAREFMQLYPNAKLLIATKDDLARDRRKYLTAKIASGEWDGITVTHSSLKLALHYPRVEASTGMPPASPLLAEGRWSLSVIERDGVSG